MCVLPLARFVSDHKSILLKISRMYDRRFTFRLEKFRFREEDFMDSQGSLVYSGHWQVDYGYSCPETEADCQCCQDIGG